MNLQQNAFRGKSLIDIYLVDFGTRLSKFTYELFRLPTELSILKPGVTCCMLSDIIPYEVNIINIKYIYLKNINQNTNNYTTIQQIPITYLSDTNTGLRIFSRM